MTLVYKDMTFCVNKQCTKKCNRYLTCEIKAKAKAFGLPIAVASFICVDKGEDGIYKCEDVDERLDRK